MISNTDRYHEFFFTQRQDGKWVWTWLVPLQVAALSVSSIAACKTKAGAYRNAVAATNKLRRQMVELSRGDMI